MAISRINKVESTLIGISFMKDKHEEQLRKVWMERFGAKNKLNTIYVENNDSIEEAFENVIEALQDLNIDEIYGDLILAVFLDFEDSDQVEIASQMEDLYVEFEEQLGKEIWEFIIFDRVGTFLRTWKDKKEVLREMIVPSVYDRMRTFLVGRTVLIPEENEWKGEIALLDSIIRDKQNVVSAYFLQGVIGFIKYKDSKQGLRKSYLCRLEKIGNLLGDKGEDEVKRALDDYVSEHLESAIANNCKPVHGVMPLPKEILSKPGHFGGGADAYRKALSRTTEAVNQTAISMKEYIETELEALIECAPEMLDIMLEKSEAGLKLLQNQQAMKRIFDPGSKFVADTRISLNGKYSREEVEEEIFRMLDSSYKQELSSAKVDLLNAYYKAFENRPQENFEQKQRELEEEKHELQQRLSKIPDAGKFVDDTMQSKNYISAFKSKNTSLNSVENKALLFSGSELLQNLENNGYNNQIQPIFYEPTSGYNSVEALSSFMYKDMQQIEQILQDLI